VPFRFRLEAPLRLSRVTRQERRRQLGEAVRQAALAEERERQARAAAERAAAARVAMTRQGVSGAELRWLDEQLRRGRQGAARAASSAAETARQEEQARTALAEETRRLEALEQMKLRRWAEFRRELRRREQQQIDEITLNRFARRDRGAQSEEER
jgi:flagellar export protein FliJ